jgi:hypothetical protein
VLREQARSKCHDGRSNGRTRASHCIVSTPLHTGSTLRDAAPGPRGSRHPASARGQAAPRRCQRDDCPVSHRCRVSALTRHLLTNRLVERRLLRDRPAVSAHEEEGHTRPTGADGPASDVVRVRAIRACVKAPEN